MGLESEPGAMGEQVPSGEWECMECGHIEAGIEIIRPRQCPDCGAPGQALEFFPYDDDAVERE